MNDLQWLYWDRQSALQNPRQQRVVEVLRALAITPSQLERFLMLESGQLIPWCQSEVANRYAAMRLVRIHRVVVRNRAYLPARFEMGSWMKKKLVDGQSALDILRDPYFLEHRLERVLVMMARRSGSFPKSTKQAQAQILRPKSFRVD